MVRLEDIPRSKSELLPYSIAKASEAQIEVIKEYVDIEYPEFETLRGFHMFMRSEDLTYYDIIRMYYR